VNGDVESVLVVSTDTGFSKEVAKEFMNSSMADVYDVVPSSSKATEPKRRNMIN
jgi:hypothetical protein